LDILDGLKLADEIKLRVTTSIAGDVAFRSASEESSFITPVPGGGPLTSDMLLENTLVSAQRNERVKSPFMM
jgi:5,10-methylene-tetrahydrofolate dehydrogenase/methenyl tetrahydrofolate cyclohydrolase